MSVSRTGSFAFVLLLASVASAQDLDAPEAVARLELVVPARPRVLLHGTIPIPKGRYPLVDRSTPFAVLNHDPAATLVPAQVRSSRATRRARRTSSRFAPSTSLPRKARHRRVVPDRPVDEQAGEGADRAEAVQKLLRARVTGTSASARATCTETSTGRISGDVSDPSSGSLRILKTGPYVRQRRVYATMVPVGTPSPAGAPLPHLLGVHAYVTEKAGQREVDLDLRLNNGATSGSRDPTPLEEPLGIVYWKTIQLVIPDGWTAVAQVADPFLGAPRVEGVKSKRVVVVPLVLPFPEGRLHMMGPQAQLERRSCDQTGAEKNAKAPRSAARESRAFDPGLAFSAGRTCGRGSSGGRYPPARSPATFDLASRPGRRAAVSCGRASPRSWPTLRGARRVSRGATSSRRTSAGRIRGGCRIPGARAGHRNQ